MHMAIPDVSGGVSRVGTEMFVGKCPQYCRVLCRTCRATQFLYTYTIEIKYVF